jgi:putative glutamine amidotransferase
MTAPIVGIPCDRRMVGDHPFHRVGEKYIVAVRDGAGALPLLIPSLGPPLELADLLASVDGFLFTGSASNVAPHHYGGREPRFPELLDEARDSITLPLMQAGIELGVPMLCICRGFQELNVALGGTLHQHLEEVPGYSDHRERDEDPVDVQYGPAHPVRVQPGGVLATLVPAGSDVTVNSLHSQGIDRLAPPLFVEAVAPDGPVEAVSMKGAKGFVVGVQWHPEWKFREQRLSVALFRAFGEAVSAYAWKRRRQATSAS